MIIEASSRESGIRFLIFGATLAFAKFKQASNTIPIFHYFDSQYHIAIGINISSYVINAIFGQLTLDNLSQWHLIAFVSQKTILAKTEYEIHNSAL